MNKVLVVGGGIAGIQAALDLANQDIPVYLIEKSPSLGGKMAQLDKTFPTLDCSSCILTPKMVDVSRHKNIQLLTYSDIKSISKHNGNFEVTIVKHPRYVDEEKCTSCLLCIQKCPYRAPSEFNLNLSKQKSIAVPFPQAVPLIPVINPEFCAYFTKDGKCKACEKYCEPHAIDFTQTEEIIKEKFSSIIYATGFKLYDPAKNQDYGYSIFKDVVTSLELERMLSATGPSEGNVLRFSNGEIPKKVAIVLCVGSRDKTANYYCSRFCCMASIKQSILLKDHHPETDCTVFYMDIRAYGKGFQEFYQRAIDDYGVKFIKGKIGKVEHDEDQNILSVKYENIDSGKIEYDEFEMIVLAVGAEPPINGYSIPLKVSDDGFVEINNPHLDPVKTSVDGIFVAGCLEGPKDIPDSVVQAGAAAIQAAIYEKVKTK